MSRLQAVQGCSGGSAGCAPGAGAPPRKPPRQRKGRQLSKKPGTGQPRHLKMGSTRRARSPRPAVPTTPPRRPAGQSPQGERQRRPAAVLLAGSCVAPLLRKAAQYPTALLVSPTKHPCSSLPGSPSAITLLAAPLRTPYPPSVSVTSCPRSSALTSSGGMGKPWDTPKLRPSTAFLTGDHSAAAAAAVLSPQSVGELSQTQDKLPA